MIIPLFIRNPRNTSHISIFYGLSSGVLIMSLGVFVLPSFMKTNPSKGSLTLIIGVIIGYLIHTIGHQSNHIKSINKNTSKILELTIHSLLVGFVIGIFYSSTPDLSIILGLSIISHKLPASYSILIELKNNKNIIIIPSVSLGISSIITYKLLNTIPNRVTLLGLSAGILLHLSMDFLISCQKGAYVKSEDHKEKDKQRILSTISIVIGSIIIYLLYILI